MLFTLWGDYVVHRGGEIWVGSLIRIGAEFGLSELALRSVLSRMTRGGWLESTRHGNRGYYRLARRGIALIQEGAERIFRPRREPWDGSWHVLTYSIPEAQREVRDQFRKRISYLGFGSLAVGAWIAPHDLRSEVDELIEDLGSSVTSTSSAAPILALQPGPRSRRGSGHSSRSPSSITRFSSVGKVSPTRSRPGCATRGHSCCASG
jgi:DNA-binding transcriptional regulator PaaX